MKKFRDILSDMASWIHLSSSKVNNFTVGSVVRSILEAVAMEIEELYAFIRAKFNDLQDNSIYKSFGFAKKPATPATGIVTVRFGQPLNQSVLFEKGYRFFTQPINGVTMYFKTTKEVIATVGNNEVKLLVECEEAGTIGNVPAMAITRAVNPTPFMGSIYNESDFFTGLPEETAEARQKRFNQFVESLGRGTQPAIQYGIKQIKGVQGVYIREDVGIIYVYVHDAFGNLDDDLRQKVKDQLYEYKTGGIKAIISGVTAKKVDLNIKVLIADGYEKPKLMTKIQSEVQNYMNRRVVSQGLIRADLIRFIMEINKEAIQNVNLGISADIVVEPQDLLRPGTIQVTEMG